jgi:hypothetical protein
MLLCSYSNSRETTHSNCNTSHRHFVFEESVRKCKKREKINFRQIEREEQGYSVNHPMARHNYALYRKYKKKAIEDALELDGVPFPGWVPTRFSQ